MSPAFDAASLQGGYAFLDGCPVSLFHDVVTLPFGSLRDRAAGIGRWRDSLLAGRLPRGEGWPPPAVAGPVLRSLDEMGLARFCKDQPDLVDALLKDVLGALARGAEVLKSEVAERLRELETLERAALVVAEEQRARSQRRKPRMVRVEEATLGRLRARADREARQRERGPDQELIAAWEERARVWAEIAEVFGDLGELMGRGWDLSLGVLRHAGWLDLLRLRQLVEQLPQLREIVRALGRLQISDSSDSVAERLLVPVRRLKQERREVVTPRVPAETRGVERGGEISRMLPVEASMLGHPKLRFLWHARRAERALLSYRVEGVEVEQVSVLRDTLVEVDGRRPRPERGPIIAVIDTSGSMHGLPEQVAKALVLEALRTAHAEQRRCLVYTYGGPGQILEHELDLTTDGVGRLLAFLGLSFGGGSDETGVIERVLARMKQGDWTKADVVFVSDGEWPAPVSLTVAAQRARDDGTRFHGVQIGNLGRTGLHEICDPVHVFQDWATAGGWHSPS